MEKKKYTQKFKKDWLYFTEYQDWLAEIEGDKSKCRCKICDIVLAAKLFSIKTHSKSQHHQKNIENTYTKNVGEDIENVYLDGMTRSESVRLSRHKSTEWKGVCLVCLRKKRKIQKPIFENDNDGIPIYQKILECTTFEIQENMNIPTNICMDCFEDLLVAYRFRKNCEKSYKALEMFIYNTNSISETVEDFVETLSGKDDENNVKFRKKSKNEQKSIQIDNTTNNDNETFIIMDVKQSDSILDGDEQYTDNDDSLNQQYGDESCDEQYIDYDNYDDEDDVVGTVLNNENLYIKCEDDANEEDDANDEDQNEEMVETEVGVPLKMGNNRKPQTKLPLICEICGNKYTNRFSFNAHLKRHVDEKTHICEFCNKRFILRQQLNCHMRTHTGEKPYSCQYCGKTFSHCSTKIRHERTHTGERPYECEKCGKAFMYPQVLKAHRNTHV